MYELGKKDEVIGLKVTDLVPLSDIWQRPTSMPRVGENEVVLCGYNQGLGERMIVCESLQDMQELYDAYAGGGALNILWYRGKTTKAVILGLGPDEGIAGGVINQSAPDAPAEVKEVLAAYAKGNPGAARVLSERAKDFTSAKQVEELVGWPLSEHSLERTGDIWNRFKAEPGSVCKEEA